MASFNLTRHINEYITSNLPNVKLIDPNDKQLIYKSSFNECLSLSDYERFITLVQQLIEHSCSSLNFDKAVSYKLYNSSLKHIPHKQSSSFYVNSVLEDTILASHYTTEEGSYVIVGIPTITIDINSELISRFYRNVMRKFSLSIHYTKINI